MNEKSNKRAAGAGRGNDDAIVAELNGFIELGMKRDALKLARECLKRKPLAPGMFNEAMNAVLTLADTKKSWASQVESAHGRLPKREQPAARHWMLSFHCATGNYQRARDFIPWLFNGTFGLLELGFALETLLALGKLDDAARLVKTCRRASYEAGHHTMRQLLKSNLAEFHLRKGEWDKSLELLRQLAGDDSFVENRLIGPVEIHVARALKAARAGLEELESLKNDFDPELEIILPGNNDARWKQAEWKLKRFAAKLAKILPAARWRELGLGI